MIYRKQVQEAIRNAEEMLFRNDARALTLMRSDLEAFIAAARAAQYHCINPKAAVSPAYESSGDYIEGA